MAAKKKATRKRKALTADQILSKQDIKLERVEVPEWGGAVYVKTMNGTDRDEFDMASYSARKDATEDDDGTAVMRNFRARTVAACACDEAGKRIFTMEQAAQLGGKSSAALDRVFTVARRLNRLSDEDVDELAGN